MEQLFANRLAEVEGHRAANWRLWLAAVGDVISQAVREHGLRSRETLSGLVREGARMDGWRQDLQFGVRMLVRRPGFTSAAIVTLALGIGASVAIFSVVHGVLLRPLPYPDSDQLVTLVPHQA